MSVFGKIRDIIDKFSKRRGCNLRWFFRYAAGGTATAVLEMGAFFLLSRWAAPWQLIVSLLPQGLRASAADELQMWAIVVSNIIAYIFNYFVSKYWVFRSPDTRHSRDALLFAASCVVNLILVLVSAKALLLGLSHLPVAGELWEKTVPIIAKIGSNAIAFITVLIFKRFIIWSDTDKY